MVAIDKHFRLLDKPSRIYKIVMAVHDEVLAVVPEDYADTGLKFMKAVMSTSPKWAKGLPLACKGKAARSYGEAK
jgi:DNA polymerase I-like protein with 3'-5' exonuclease and polymerase domains